MVRHPAMHPFFVSGIEQPMDAVFLAGCNNTMAMPTMSLGIEVEAEAETDERSWKLRQRT